MRGMQTPAAIALALGLAAPFALSTPAVAD